MPAPPLATRAIQRRPRRARSLERCAQRGYRDPPAAQRRMGRVTTGAQSDMKVRLGRSWLLAAGLVLVVGVVLPTQAAAHAVLLRTIPPTRQTLSGAPDQVRLLFSEPIDAAF